MIIFTSGHLAVYVLLSICSQTSTSSDSDILLRKCCEGLLIFVLRARYKDYKQTICFWIGLLLHCCKQSVQVSHIHYAYAIFRATFLVRFIIILVIPVTNFTFIHKSWQQIRRGDAHDSRSQNWKAVQKNEVIFTVRRGVCLSVCLSVNRTAALTASFTPTVSPPSMSYDHFLDFGDQTLPVRLVLSNWHALNCGWVAKHCNSRRWPCWFWSALGNPWWHHAFIYYFSQNTIRCVSCISLMARLLSGLTNNEISESNIPFTPQVILTPNMYIDK